MKPIVSLFLVLTLFFYGCTQQKKNFSDPPVIVYSPAETTGFIIKGYEDSPNTLIEVRDPWQGAEGVNTTFMIVRDSVVPDGYDGQYIMRDAQRIICMSSTHIGMLEVLDMVERIVGVSGIEYVSNPYINNNADKIADVGYEGHINYEAILRARPDLILLFSINGSSLMEGKLKELGIPFIYIGDYVEESPLGKAEWLVAIGELTGKREESVRLFDGIKHRYEILRDSVVGAEMERPSVMLNMPFADSWFMPSTESYVARLVEDAGGNYIYGKNTGSVSEPIDLEEAFQLVSNSDFWLNTGNIKTLDQLKSALPRFSEVKSLRNGNVYNNNLKSTPAGGNDCYESGVVNPDLILRDLIKIFHPQLIEDSLVYYHRLK